MARGRPLPWIDLGDLLVVSYEPTPDGVLHYVGDRKFLVLRAGDFTALSVSTDFGQAMERAMVRFHEVKVYDKSSGAFPEDMPTDMREALVALWRGCR